MRFFTQTVLRRTVGAPLVGARNGMDGHGQAQGLTHVRDDRRRRVQNAYGLVILLDALSVRVVPESPVIFILKRNVARLDCFAPLAMTNWVSQGLPSFRQFCSSM